MLKAIIVGVFSVLLVSSAVAAKQPSNLNTDVSKTDTNAGKNNSGDYRTLVFSDYQLFDPNLTWPGAYYGNDTVVMVMMNRSDDHDLFFRTAKPEENGNLHFLQPGGYSSDTRGWSPKVAVTSKGTVIAVHEAADTEEQRMYYRTGKLTAEKNTIIWNKWYEEYNNGHTPSIAAMGDRAVISVHGYGDGHVYYNMAPINKDDTVNFHKDAIRVTEDHGVAGNPSVTVLSDDSVVIAWANNFHSFADDDNDKIYYRAGRINYEKNIIEWYGGVQEFGDGGAPSLTTIKGDTIMVAYGHEIDLVKPSGDEDQIQSIYYRTGKLDTKNGVINWYQGDEDEHAKVLTQDTGGHRSVGRITYFTTFTTNDYVYVVFSADDGSYYMKARI
ncbi:MAG: hypothetical protein P1U34_09305 [Coxiellaceae bacterium]|nr:hypothetical protein [Coxiellaceae bacterium]